MTAEDRTWQLEHARLRAEGRTASVLGAPGLPWDRFARRARLEELARRATERLSAESAALLAAYADGVNAGLAEAGPVPELVELGTGPGRWSDWTPLGVFAAAHALFATFPGKLWRHHVEERAGTEVAELLGHEGLWAAGSNSWAVGGGRTASGLPMIGGDPHRTFEAPNVYAQVRLTCRGADGFDVAGFTFPGVPGVQHFAHAGRVAWGITNAMADYQDLYLERLRRAGDQVLAEGVDGWHPASVHRERIEVRDGTDEDVEVVVTENGPVVLGGPEEPLALSLRTPSYVAGALGFDALLPLLRARSADDVEAALSCWVEPVNNLLVADDQGAVRQRVVGLVPERAEANRHRPVPGWLAEHRWTGWLEGLPSTRVGAEGHLVTANHRMTPDFDRIGTEFAPPARASRIEALLAGRSGLRPDDFAAVHRDDLAGQPAALLDAVLRLRDLAPPAAALRDQLAAWDQHLGADSVTAAAYVAVRDRFVTSLAATGPFAVLGGGSPHGELFAPWFAVPVHLHLALPNLLSERGRSLVPDLEEHLVAALDAVAAQAPGTWGERHRYRPVHALGRRLEEEPGLAGDNDCVRCTGALPGGDAAVRGSVARYVWDLAGLSSSGWVVPLGASGDLAHHHGTDQLPAWVEGVLLPVARGVAPAAPGVAPI